MQAAGLLAAADVKPAEPVAPETIVPASVLELLELPEGTAPAKVAAAILTLKNPTDMVPRAEFETLQARLAEVDSTAKKQRIDTLVASNRKKITPAMETFIRARAEKDYADAEAIVANLSEQLPTPQSPGTDPTPAGTVVVPTSVVVDGQERRVNASAAQLKARNEEIMKEKGVSYIEANELRRKEEAAR